MPDNFREILRQPLLNLFIASVVTALLSRTFAVAEVASSSAGKEETALAPESCSFTQEEKPKYDCKSLKNFDYVNSKAPQGGEIRVDSLVGSWGTMIPGQFPKVMPMPGLDWLSDSLMRPSADDHNTLYPSLAKSIQVAADCSYVIFNLDERAHFNRPGDDGCHRPPNMVPSPRVTAKDVAFSFEQNAQKGAASAMGLLRNVSSVEMTTNPNQIRFKLDVNTCNSISKSTIFAIAAIPIFSAEHFKEQKLNFSDSSMKPLMFSGPYVIEKADKLNVSYKKVCDYWGKDLPENKGRYNFGRITYKVYRDSIIRDFAFGDEIDYMVQQDPKRWPPVKGLVNKNILEKLNSGEAQARAVKFQNPLGSWAVAFNEGTPELNNRKVREALSLLYPKEQIAELEFGGKVEKLNTYFPASGIKPDMQNQFDSQVTALLHKVKLAHPEAFPVDKGDTDESLKPVADPQGTSLMSINRNRAEKANELMKQAGWNLKEDPASGRQVWVNKDGKKFPTLRFPQFDSTFTPKQSQAYPSSLKRFGFEVDMRNVDLSAYLRTMKQGQYDLIVKPLLYDDVPNIKLVSTFHSSRADNPMFSLNVTRTKNAGLDQIIQEAVDAPAGERRTVAILAMDRYLKRLVPYGLTAVDSRTRILTNDRVGIPEAQKVLMSQRNGESGEDPVPLTSNVLDTYWDTRAKRSQSVSGESDDGQNAH